MKLLRNLLAIMVFVFTLPAHAAVTLSVVERASLNRVNEPVTWGIPLAESDNITSISALGVSTDSGGSSEIDAQFRVLSRYNDTPDGTGAIRVVLVDFQSSVNSGQTATYYLQTSGGSGTAEGTLAATSGDDVIVTTGTMIATIDADTGWFSSILIDSDGDESVDDQVLGTATSDGWLVRSSVGTDYTTWHETSTISIEENGPLRCVVKATGYFEDSSNNHLVPTNADEGLSYTIRFMFFKNSRVVKVYPRLENENQAWGDAAGADPTHPIWVDYSYLKTTTAVSDSAETVDFGGTEYSESTSYELSMDETSDGSAQSYTWAHVEKKGGVQQVADTTQYDNYADVRDSSIGVMVGLRWFWQQHPKGYRVEGDGDELYVDLWDDLSSDSRGTTQTDASGNHRILGGMWKTHELIYYFHTDSDTDYTNAMAALRNRLIAMPSIDYIAGTNFFYSMPPSSISVQVNYDDVDLSDAIDRSSNEYRGLIDSDYLNKENYLYDVLDLRSGRIISGPGSPAYWSWYGIIEFGDFPRGNGVWGYSGSHYGWDYSSLVSFIRFQDYDYLDFAEELVTHRADITIMHDTPAYNGSETEAVWHGGNRYEQDALLSFYDDHTAAGSYNGPRGGSHLWYRGIALQYLLTGEYRFLDSLDDVAEGRKYVFFTNWDCTSDCTNNSTIRDAGRSVGALTTHYMVSGNSDSLTKAYQLYVNALQADEVTYGNGKYLQSILGANEASILQSSICIEYLIQLNAQLASAGQSAYAANVETSLDDMATWFNETIFSPYIDCDDGFETGDTGSGAHAGEYLPFMVSKLWDASSEWTCGDFLEVYLLPYIADLYAWKYAQGDGESWLDDARNMFKDWHTYGAADNWQSLASSVRDVGVFDTTNGDAWAKWGQPLKKGLYYLSTEYAEAGEDSPAISSSTASFNCSKQ